MFRPEKNEPYFVTLRYLQVLYQIPVSTDESYMKRFYLKVTLLKSAMFLFSSIGPLLHLVMSVVGGSMADLTKDIAITLHSTGGGLVGLMFTLKFQRWNDLFKDLTDTKTFGKPTEYEETVKRLIFRENIFFSSSLASSVVYGIAAWYTSEDCEEINEQKGIGEICSTFLPIWLPFGAGNVYFGSMIFVLQVVFVGFLNGTIFMNICFNFYESTQLLMCHSRHLKDNIRQIFEGTSSEETADRMRFCIKYHVHILSLASRLCTLMTNTAGYTSLLAAVVLGCAANQLMDSKPLSSMIQLMAWLAIFFIFCYSGQLIQEITLSIGDAVLESNWWKGNATTVKELSFLLLRSQKPIYFKALPFGILDYSFYLMMLKAGYSYFTLLSKK